MLSHRHIDDVNFVSVPSSVSMCSSALTRSFISPYCAPTGLYLRISTFQQLKRVLVNEVWSRNKNN